MRFVHLLTLELNWLTAGAIPLDLDGDGRAGWFCVERRLSVAGIDCGSVFLGDPC